MRYRLPLYAITGMLCLVSALACAQGIKSGIAIVPSGVDSQGRRLYTVQANNADIASLLRELFKVTGDRYSIDQDVTGLVDLKVSDATIEQVFREAIKVARPAIKLVRAGNGYRISREYSPQAAANALRERMNESMMQGSRPAAVGFGQSGNPYQGVLPANRLVTLDVPKDRPIALIEALNRISTQTNVIIRLDRRIPQQMTFSGTLSHAPLGLVLQNIAEASDLKILWENSQVMLVPTDRFQLRVNEILIGEFPAANCAKCGTRLLSEWQFCPRCGQSNPRAGSQSTRPGPARGSSLRPRNPKAPED